MGKDVTIVVTSYEQRAYLREAIESAQAQTYPARVLVVDDGSADDSAAIAEDAGVDVIRLEHQGALAAYRAGVAQVESPFYCILNGDDVLEPNYLEEAVKPMADPAIGFVYTGLRLFGARTGLVHAPPFDASRLRWGNYAHATSLARKRAYDSVGGFDQAFDDGLEDWALWVAMVTKGWKGYAVDMPLLWYRQHFTATRNPTTVRKLQAVRWRLAAKHPRYYGAWGLARLLIGTARLALQSVTYSGGPPRVESKYLEEDAPGHAAPKPVRSNTRPWE